jgi:chromosome segregation ATPase
MLQLYFKLKIKYLKLIYNMDDNKCRLFSAATIGKKTFINLYDFLNDKEGFDSLLYYMDKVLNGNIQAEVDLFKKIDQLKTENEDLKNEKQQLEDEVTTLNQSNSILTTQNDDLTKMNSELCLENNDFKDKIADLERKLKSVTASNIILKENGEIYKAKKIQLQKEVDGLKSQLNSN